MTGERDPNIVTSGFSGIVTEQGWTLEVVNQSGSSTVWDDPFATDDAAWAAFRHTVEEEGMRAFLDQAVVIPFRR